MMTRWHKLTDARGAKRKQCFINQAIKASRLTRKELLRPKESGSFWKMLFLTGALAFVLCILFLIYTLSMLLLMNPTPSSVASFVVIEFLMAIFASFLFTGSVCGYMHNKIMWRSRESAIRAMTRSGLCPSCGYEIRQIPPESDGCVVCPECNAAWKLMEC